MDLINKYINHVTWLNNALKEHNKFLNIEVKSLSKEKYFLINKSFQKANYFLQIYLKLSQNFIKGYQLLIINNRLNKIHLFNLKNNYLIRSKMYFSDFSMYIKQLRIEIASNKLSTIVLEIKNITSLLTNLESDINFLIGKIF